VCAGVQLHPVWEVLLSELSGRPDVLQALWTSVVDQVLAPSTHERKVSQAGSH
jgi:hypothetical protein